MLEVMDARKNGAHEGDTWRERETPLASRVSLARPVLPCVHSFQAPATQATTRISRVTHTRSALAMTGSYNISLAMLNVAVPWWWKKFELKLQF